MSLNLNKSLLKNKDKTCLMILLKFLKKNNKVKRLNWLLKLKSMILMNK